MSSKIERQNRILEIIRYKDIATQQELEKELSASGFVVKQATLSRDIRDLRLTKVLQHNQKYKYVYDGQQFKTSGETAKNTLRSMIVSTKVIRNEVVIRTQKDMAQSLCSVINGMQIELIEGIVFGIDTVLIICYRESDAAIVYHKINDIMK